jgi:threonine synthase
MCRNCDREYDLELTEFPCPECGGILEMTYDLDEVLVSRSEMADRSGSLWKYREVLPILETTDIVSMGEGLTPIVEAPELAEQLGVRRVLIKDEGQNPTNTFKDRGASASISGAKQQGIQEVALASAGNAGQAAAAYAATAGMDCHVFLPYQSGDIQKHLVKIHGADLHLVGGDLSDAGAAFSNARDSNGWYTVATFQTPFRLEGKKAMGYEIFEQSDWGTPDEIFYPTGGGVGLIGIWKAFMELRELGWLDDETPPGLNVVQSTGCAPVVRAIEAHQDRHVPWESPNSMGRGIEVPDPGASDWIIQAVTESGGTGVAVSDEQAVQGCIETAKHAGVEMCVEPGAAMAGAMKMADNGELDSDDEIMIINTGSGNKSSTTITYGLE